MVIFLNKLIMHSKEEEIHQPSFQFIREMNLDYGIKELRVLHVEEEVEFMTQMSVVLRHFLRGCHGKPLFQEIPCFSVSYFGVWIDECTSESGQLILQIKYFLQTVYDLVFRRSYVLNSAFISLYNFLCITKDRVVLAYLQSALVS